MRKLRLLWFAILTVFIAAAGGTAYTAYKPNTAQGKVSGCGPGESMVDMLQLNGKKYIRVFDTAEKEIKNRVCHLSFNPHGLSR